MPQLIKPGNVTIQSKQGEVRVAITLDLNVNLNTGSISVQATPKEEMSAEEQVSWAMEDFKPAKIKFGKHVKE